MVVLKSQVFVLSPSLFIPLFPPLSFVIFFVPSILYLSFLFFVFSFNFNFHSLGQTIKEHDIEQWKAKRKQMFITMAIVLSLHIYLDSAKPLFLQCFVPWKLMYSAPIFQVKQKQNKAQLNKKLNILLSLFSHTYISLFLLVLL